MLSVAGAGVASGLVTRASLIARVRSAIRGGVLKEFGVEIPADVEIRVWIAALSTLYRDPMRPKNTERMSEAQLAELVTRDSMIGVGLVKAQA